MHLQQELLRRMQFCRRDRRENFSVFDQCEISLEDWLLKTVGKCLGGQLREGGRNYDRKTVKEGLAKHVIGLIHDTVAHYSVLYLCLINTIPGASEITVENLASENVPF